TPLGRRFETGTLAHELLAGFVAAVEYIESIGWDSIKAHERTLGERFLTGLPDNVTLYGLPTMEGRVATFAFHVDGVSTQETAARRRNRTSPGATSSIWWIVGGWMNVVGPSGRIVAT